MGCRPEKLGMENSLEKGGIGSEKKMAKFKRGGALEIVLGPDWGAPSQEGQKGGKPGTEISRWE